MTDKERLADRLLMTAIANVSATVKMLDPNVTEPVAQVLLRAIDVISIARQELAKRGPMQ